MGMKPGIAVIVLFVWVAGCTTVLVHKLDQAYGLPDASRYEQAVVPASDTPEYWRDVRPVLEKRCSVCHGCYDAPCQLNLTSWQGIIRGANPEKVYTLRLLPAEPARLFIDAQTPQEWRSKQFHPVLNERANTPEANLQGSVLYRLLDLKRKQPTTQEAVLDKNLYTFSLNRKQTCPTIEQMDVFEEKHPQWGMPYGLPALSEQEFKVLETWMAAGAPAASSPVLPSAVLTQVEHWEQLLNGISVKEKLASRYLYEHLFIAHIYFDEVPLAKGERPVFFRMVRSATPPGTPVQEIPTRKPYDDPGTAEFWYRLQWDEGSIVEKTHMPYAFNAAREKKWRGWFFDADYSVEQLPSYAAAASANPFLTFQSLPIDSRYRFLLDEARFSIDNFIKGPVCRGQVALGVIDDHFWVFFIDPDFMAKMGADYFYGRDSQVLRLPSESESFISLLEWKKYEALEKQYLKSKSERMGEVADADRSPSTEIIWSGAGNDNAALTIFRHSDSATVVKGLVGQPPKTSWVIGYPLLERIHYLLVAGYDVYGNVGHQLTTRLYMDFLRMEGESNFISLLPSQARIPVRDHWYRNASDDVKNFVYGDDFSSLAETSIDYKTSDPQQELYSLLRGRVSGSLAHDHDLTSVSDKKIRQKMQALQDTIQGEMLPVLPQNSILQVQQGTRLSWFTLVNNSAYSNLSELVGQDKRRLPAEDTLTVVPGIVGAYPNAFFSVKEEELEAFTMAMAALRTEVDYTVFAGRYAVRRTDPGFWSFSDALHAAYRQAEPVTSGMLDYNRFENR